MSDQQEDLRKIYAEWPTEKLVHEYQSNLSAYGPQDIRAIKNELSIRDAKVDLSIEVPQTPPVPIKGPSPEQVLKPLKANTKIADEARCGICNGPLALGEEIVQCEKCLKYYHPKCKDEAGGCASPECQVELKKCPFCKELIPADALKCRHCGEYVDEAVRLSVLPKECPKEAKEALTYSLVGLLCFGFILGPIAIVKGLKALKIIKSAPGYPGKGRAQAAIIIGALELVLNVVGFIVRFGAMAGIGAMQ